jgi:hypothetical protein
MGHNWLGYDCLKWGVSLHISQRTREDCFDLA